MFLQVKSFLPFGGARFAVFTGDNVILVIGMSMVLTSDVFRQVKISSTTRYVLYAGIAFLLVLPLYLYMKNFIVFGAPPEGLGTLYKTVLRLIFIYYFFKYLNISDAHYKKGLNAILLFGVLITLSMLFEDLFVSMGFTVDKIGVDVERAEMINESNRYAGITGMNVNDLGALLSTFLGILFYMYKNKLVNVFQFIFYLSFISIGIMLTGSRTAFIIVNILILFFLIDYLRRLTFNSILLIAIFFVAVFYVYENFGIATVTRLEQQSDTEYFGLGLRMKYWVMYIMDIRNNPIYLLIGNLAPSTYKRSAHNFYVQIVFQTGLIFVSAGFYFIIRSIKSKAFAKKNPSILSLDFKYVLVPQLLIWMTTSSFISWFVLIGLGITGIYFDIGRRSVEKEIDDVENKISYST